ncbi:MAG TPA: ABC transporter permease [Blastocatellia bacterium]|nr:ABC transporter permease [Blastocatellia bacterium]
MTRLFRTAPSRIDRRLLRILGGGIICCFYLTAILADFLAPYDYRDQARREPMAQPSAVRFRDADGDWHLRPRVCARLLTDPLQLRYEEDRSRCHPIRFWIRGYRYRFLFYFESDLHLFGVDGLGREDAPRAHLLGTDAVGRDRLSRLLIATRFSLMVGPAGTILASLIGVVLGCIAGYTGRWLDAFLMRIVDLVMALPPLVMILAARATFPLELPPSRAALLLIAIFVTLGWAEMARLTRSLVAELSEREFVLAAVSVGLPPWRVLYRHILPNAAPLILAQALLMLPNFLLFETALSFLGVGLQEPDPSWGNLLAAAKDITLLPADQALLLLAPALTIVVFVFGTRLLRDGLTPSS